MPIVATHGNHVKCLTCVHESSVMLGTLTCVHMISSGDFFDAEKVIFCYLCNRVMKTTILFLGRVFFGSCSVYWMQLDTFF